MATARKLDPEVFSTTQSTVPVPTRRANSNIVAGSLWMVGISLALFFLPAINGLIGGLVGGYKVGTPRNALVAAVLPALVTAIGLVVFLSVLGFPVLGLFAGVTIGFMVALSEIGLFLGAWIGGLIASRQPTR